MSPLRISLVGFGIIFCSVYGLFQIDLFGGWAWSPGQPEYQLMIVGIYLVMGLMMIFQALLPVLTFTPVDNLMAAIKTTQTTPLLQ